MSNDQPKTGVIFGSGAEFYPHQEPVQRHRIETAYGDVWTIEDEKYVYIHRHGLNHQHAPHLVPYRANIMALYLSDVKRIIAINAVGCVRDADRATDNKLTIPSQLIDYTWGRDSTFYGEPLSAGLLGLPASKFPFSTTVNHIEFSQPFSPFLRDTLIKCAERAGISINPTGTVGVTQGPRFETRAEVARLRRDGVDLVGMTSMPEAILAAELQIAYASICITTNSAISPEGVDAVPFFRFKRILEEQYPNIKRILDQQSKMNL